MGQLASPPNGMGRPSGVGLARERGCRQLAGQPCPDWGGGSHLGWGQAGAGAAGG